MLDVNLNVADVSLVTDPSAGPLVMVTAGPVLLTVHENCAGPEEFPAGSAAVTENVCGPSPTMPYVVGLVQAAGVPSSVHVNDAVASASVQANVAGTPLGSAGCCVITGVAGGVVSTVKDRTAGDGSVFPAASVAFTVRE